MTHKKIIFSSKLLTHLGVSTTTTVVFQPLMTKFA